MQRRQLTALLLAPLLASGQQVLCSLAPTSADYKSASDQRPSPDALELTAKANTAARRICGKNCPSLVLYRNSTASALMLIADAGRAKLVYSPQVFTAVYDRYGDAGIVALLAHSLGHALDDAIGAAWIDQSANPEIRADSWAGCILAQGSFPPMDRDFAMAALKDHPFAAQVAWNARLAALRNGYSHCGGMGSLDKAAPASPNK